MRSRSGFRCSTSACRRSARPSPAGFTGRSTPSGCSPRIADFEILSPAQFGVVCFRAHPAGIDDAGELDALNERINARVNATGRFLISSTKLRGRFSLRLCTHVHRMTDADIDEVYEAILEAAREVA